MAHNDFGMGVSEPKSRLSGESGSQCLTVASASPVAGPGAPAAWTPGDIGSLACWIAGEQHRMTERPSAAAAVAAVVLFGALRSNPISLSTPCA